MLGMGFPPGVLGVKLSGFRPGDECERVNHRFDNQTNFECIVVMF